MLFGVVADRYGRTRALVGSVLIYSVFTAACGLAQSVAQLAAFRVLLGLGMGGEWASGAALVSETWPAQHRGKALGWMQSSWAIGYARGRHRDGDRAAALGLARGVLRRRAAGAVHALGTAQVEEPEMWRDVADDADAPGGSHGLRRPVSRRPRPADRGGDADERLHDVRVVGIQPVDSRLPVAAARAGRRRPAAPAMSGMIVAMQVGMWLGYVTFGYVSDTAGRKRTYITYLTSAAALILVYGSTGDPRAARCSVRSSPSSAPATSAASAP